MSEKRSAKACNQDVANYLAERAARMQKICAALSEIGEVVELLPDEESYSVEIRIGLTPEPITSSSEPASPEGSRE